jgi:signal transduction histidine kinase
MCRQPPTPFRAAISPTACGFRGAATSSIGSPRPSTTCWTASRASWMVCARSPTRSRTICGRPSSTRARARLEDAALHARDASDLHAAVERATSDLDGIVSVFQGLLRIAEIEAGSRRSAFASLDVYALLADLHELYGAAAEEQGQQIDLLAKPPLSMFGDRDLLQQAVANLLENALKFSPAGKPILLGAARLGDRIEIVVADSGPGIPLEDRARVTERFYRGESARSTPGSGLGLSLVQAVVQLHNGSLALEDNHPGVRAVLSLPAEFSASRRLVKVERAGLPKPGVPQPGASKPGAQKPTARAPV